MKYPWMLLPLAAAMLLTTACNDDKGVEPQEVTQGATEEEIPPTNAAFPDADPNAVNFGDGDYSFASVWTGDADCAEGTLSVEVVDGNYMLKFTDTSTTAETMEDMVQKVRFDVKQLLSPEQLESVHSIGFDICAEATSDLYVNEDGMNAKAPGWVGGGGGTIIGSDEEWYGFADFDASNDSCYVLERSDFTHVEFTFILSSTGKKWDASQEEVYFQVMRWGMKNLSNMYIDNITFYDEEGNSIPLTRSEPEAPAEGTEASETTAETTAE